jgi:SAM-dependent methyltransferase
MTGFSPGWLALRAPFDGQARDRALAQSFAAALPRAPLIVDLGAGTGTNVLALAPLAGPGTRFRLVDNDRALLDIARARLADSIQFETMHGDLDRDFERLTADAGAITASALMDLVSATWFDALTAQAASRRLPLFFTLTVDGRHEFMPADGDDGPVFAAFARDQRRDKGLGPALGPDAPRHMHDRLIMLGARVSTADSDWKIGGDGRELASSYIRGVAEAAARAAPADAAAISAWLGLRQKQIADGSLAITVGHKDLLALW